MDQRKANGVVALVILAAVVAALLYFDMRAKDDETTAAFAPAQSADESVPPPEAVAAAPDSSATEAPSADVPAGDAVVAATDATGVEPDAAAGTAMAVAPPAADAAGGDDTAAAAAAPEAVADAAAPAAPSAGSDAAGDDLDIALLSTEDSASAAAEPAPAVDGITGLAPTFDVVRVEPTGDAVIAGRSEAHAVVEVLDGAEAIASSKATGAGEWVVVLEEPLPPGAHDLGIRATAPDRTVAVLSEQRVTVSVPDAGDDEVLVVLNSPNEPSRVLQVPEETPAGADVAAAPDAGTATGDAVEAEAGAADVAAAPATTTTETAPSTEMAAAEPVAEPAADATDAEGAAEVAGEPAAPPADGATETADAAPEAAPAAGDEAADVAALPAEPEAPAAPPPPEPAVVVAAVEADTDGTLYIAGTATTPETVRVYMDGTMLGDAKPSPSGTWLLETTRDMPAGTYTVRADQVGSDGAVIARSEVPFEREVEVATLTPTVVASSSEGAALSVAMPAMQTVIIKRGDNLWRIARSNWGEGLRWSTIYQANTDQIRNPHLIYPGQVFIVPKGDVNWTD